MCEPSTKSRVVREEPILNLGVVNLEPLLINTAGSWSDRPNATTRIDNLMLAADYVRTNTDLATMEGANEAARRAVNGVLAASGRASPPCGVLPLEEPGALAWLREDDARRFARGQHHRLTARGSAEALLRELIARAAAWQRG